MPRLGIDQEEEPAIEPMSKSTPHADPRDVDDDHSQADAAQHPVRSLSRTYLCGAAFGMTSLLFVLFGGAASLLQRSSAGAMYDAQARSMLDGHWDVPAAAAGIEAFGFAGKNYIYFGPFPAVLRMPLLLFTDRFDGRLGQLSILIAVVVAVIAVAGIVEEVAHRIEAPAVIGRFGRAMVMLFGGVTTGGSMITFLAFRGDIYNEAIAWGLATALMSVAALLRALRTGSIRYIIAAGAFASASIGSRITLGTSAIAALALVLLCTTTVRTRRTFGISGQWAQRSHRLALTAAVVAPTVLFAGVQLVKFGTLLVRPSNHLLNLGRPDFADYVAENGDTYFRPEFVPSTLINTTIWPSAFDLNASFPWLRPVDLDLGSNPTGARFLGRSWSGSLLSTQTLLLVLALGGAWSVIANTRRRCDGSTIDRACASRDLTPVIVGSSIGFVATLAYAYQYHRFLTDSFPAVLLLAAVGTIAIASRTPSSKSARTAFVGVAVALAIWSVWANVATAIVSQTERVWDPAPAAFNRLIELEDTFGGDLDVTKVPLDQPLGTPTEIGSILVIGDCDALLASAGQDGFGPLWWPVAMGPSYSTTFGFDAARLPIGVTILAVDSVPTTPSTISIEVDEDRSMIVLRSGGTEKSVQFNPSADSLRLDVNPIWVTLTLDIGGEIKTLPWSGHLDIADLPASIHRSGGDSMSLCRQVAELS